MSGENNQESSVCFELIFETFCLNTQERCCNNTGKEVSPLCVQSQIGERERGM